MLLFGFTGSVKYLILCQSYRDIDIWIPRGLKVDLIYFCPRNLVYQSSDKRHIGWCNKLINKPKEKILWANIYSSASQTLVCLWITGGILFKCWLWFSKSEVGPEILHFPPAPRWCCCGHCRSFFTLQTFPLRNWFNTISPETFLSFCVNKGQPHSLALRLKIKSNSDEAKSSKNKIFP